MTLRTGRRGETPSSGVNWDRALSLSKAADVPAGYSSIFEGEDGRLGVLWETDDGSSVARGCFGGYCEIVLTLTDV